MCVSQRMVVEEELINEWVLRGHKSLSEKCCFFGNFSVPFPRPQRSVVAAPILALKAFFLFRKLRLNDCVAGFNVAICLF